MILLLGVDNGISEVTVLIPVTGPFGRPGWLAGWRSGAVRDGIITTPEPGSRIAPEARSLPKASSLEP